MIIVDMHNDTAFKYFTEFENVEKPSKEICLLCHESPEEAYQITLDKLIESGVNVAFFAAFSTYEEGELTPNHRQMSMLNFVLEGISHHNELIALGLNSKSISNAIETGKIIAMLSLEGLYGIGCEDDLYWLDLFYDKGIRLIAPVWNDDNSICAGTYGDGYGFTELGYKVLDKMKELGILLDISHMHLSSVDACLNYFDGPIIASHSGSASITPHPRNLSDDHIKKIANSGGVISIPFYGEFLKRTPNSEGDILDLGHQIDYIINLVGDDYVGIGSDFDGCTPINELSDITKLSRLIQSLGSFGYTEKRIEKIMGLNNLRVLKALK